MSLPIQMKHVVPLVIIAVLASGCSSIAPAPSSTTGAVFVPTNSPQPAIATHTAASTPHAAGNQPEQTLAWQQVQAVLPPEVPILAPTWLPDSIHKLQPQPSLNIRHDSLSGFTYAVSYEAGHRSYLTFSVGSPSPVQRNADTKVSLTLRGTNATLITQGDFTSLQWNEQGHTYAILSAGFSLSQDDLLRLAESLRPLAPIPAQTPDAWAKARALLPPTIAVYKPGWMPERFGQAELVEAVTGKADAVRYTIAYHSGSEETVFFILNIGADALGNSPPTQGTSEKVRVLGNEALFLAAPEDGRLELNWHADKQRYQMKVYGKGHQVTRDELLRIANSLMPVPATPTP